MCGGAATCAGLIGLNADKSGLSSIASDMRACYDATSVNLDETTWGNQAPAQYTARLSGSNIKMQTDIVGQHGVVNNDLPYVSGTTSDKVSFGRIKGEGTFCSLTRYTSSNSQKRILLGGKPGGASNWLHGHWEGFCGYCLL